MSALVNQARSRVPQIAEAAIDRARLRVVPRGLNRAPRVPFVMLVSLLMVAGVAGLLAFNTSMQQASFTATAMEQQAGELAAREQSLQMDLERLRDPQRVAEEARSFGMVPPSNPVFLRLSDGKVLGDPVPAVAADGLRVIDLPATKPALLNPPAVRVRERSGPASPTTKPVDDGAAGAGAVNGADSKRPTDGTVDSAGAQGGQE